MRISPKLCLAIAVIVATTCCCSGYKTQLQYMDIVNHMLTHDQMYANILREKIILENGEIPKSLQLLVKEPSEVVPLKALWELNRSSTRTSFSGKRLELSSVILGRAIGCLVYKRIAFHVALTIQMIATLDYHQLVVRSKVFAHVLPSNADLLLIIKNYPIHLLNLYVDVRHIILIEENDIDNAKKNEMVNIYVDQLNGHLTELTEFVKSSCTMSTMDRYYGSLELKSVDLDAIDGLIANGHRISDGMLTSAQIADLMMENENAMLDFPLLIPSVTTMSMASWTTLLKTPGLPTDSNEFRRVMPPSLRQPVMNMMEKD